MPLTAQQAADLIMENVKAARAGGPAAGAAAAANDFCTLWPQAKPVLEAAAMIVLLFPGLGAAAAGVLRGLIAIGDQIFKERCG